MSDIVVRNSNMTIQEWFARSVAVGLMQDDVNIWVKWNDITESWWITYFDPNSQGWEIDYTAELFCNRINEGIGGKWVQLRKDGKDLYNLEWKKPTEQDVGKMCFFYRDNTTILDELFEVCKDNNLNLIYFDRLNEPAKNYYYDYCLLANHGQIAPTESDFKRIYGE